MEVATTANPSKDGDAKPRGYRAQAQCSSGYRTIENGAQFMLRVRRIASTTVGALAILGCAGDAIVAPTTAQLAERTVTPHHAAVDTVISPTAVAGPTLRMVTSAPHRTVPVAAHAKVRADRFSRDQTLGFVLEKPSSACINEGESTGQWQLRYSGYGCVTLAGSESGTSLSMQPATAEADSETHAPLLLGPQFGDRMVMNARVETVQQLRRNGEPNSWEVAWIVWQYQDDAHFYYFIPKPNGWELGKRDPSYPGGQRFLATGAAQKFPVGHAYNVQITHRGNTFAVVVDGEAIVNFTDSERPYLSGRIALYSEDAAIKVHQVSVHAGL